MLAFGRVPVPYRTVVANFPTDKVVRVDEEKEQQVEDMERERQRRSRYYEKLAVLPQAQFGPPSRVSSDSASRPVAGSAVPIPPVSSSSSASSFPSASRFSRSSAVQSSHSLPSALRRSQPIDIPSGRRSNGAATNAAAMWYRREWQGGAEDTDSSDGSGSSSGDSDAADEWCGGGSQSWLSESFVDDSHLQWTGRCLDDSNWPADISERSVGAARWKAHLGGAGSGDEDSGSEDQDEDEDLTTPFPLLPPSYHVDFELN